MKLAKKVLQVSPAYFPATSIGGPIFTNLTFTKALEDLGCHVEVVATTQGLEESQIAQMELGKPDQSDFSYTIWRFRYWGYSHFTFSPGLFFWLLKHTKRFDLVVLQAVWNFPIWMAYLCCLLYAKPFIVIPHGSLYPETVGLKSSRIKRLFLGLYVRRMLRNAAHVLFSTQDEKRKVGDFLQIPMNGAVLPNIIDIRPFQSLPTRGAFRKNNQIEPDAPLLVHYGRVSPKKGIHFVLDCLPKLIIEYPSIRYVIAGGEDIEYAKELRQIIQKMGIQKHVIFLGLISQDEGLMLLRDSDLFILPSLSENFGMSVVEAMLCETATIVSEHVGIAAELQEADCAKVVNIETRQLGTTISELLTNKKLRLEMGVAGARFVQLNYTADIVKDKLKMYL
jgi:glycosyltransferase involved in cell wall biosynthesis